MLVAAVLALPVLPRASGSPAGPASAPAGDPARRLVRPRAPEGIEAEKVKRGGETGGGWLQTLAALAVVIALIFVVRMLLRRLSGSAGVSRRGRAMEVLAREAIGSRQQLSLVRLGRRLVLVGSGPSGMSRLAEITDPDEVAELVEQVRSAGGVSLSGLFGRFGKGGEAGSADEEGKKGT